MNTAVPFGSAGETVFNRTYSRKKKDGTKENWYETVDRVVTGNLALVYGPPETWSTEVNTEFARLTHYMDRFAIIPAGRQLWASGVEGRQYLFNCHVSGWGEQFSDHFEFSSMRLFEGGGVGANYSTKHIAKYGAPKRSMNVGIYAHPSHKDHDELAIYTTFAEENNGFWFKVDDSREGWAAALSFLIDQAMADTWTYDQIVFDVQDVRPSGSPLVSSGGVASGPAPLARMLLDVTEILNKAHERGKLTPIDAMEIDHSISEAVVAGGNRRSARMSILHWNDPYIMDFIKCKQDTGKHWTTNISVEVDDEFFALLGQEVDPAKCQNHKAFIVHLAVIEGMLTNGEPGYWNSSLSNVGELGEIIATNPCGEIALEAWENCNLGHVNLDAFAPKPDGKGGRTQFDYAGMKEAHRLMTRFLIRSTYGDVNDPKQAAQLARNRRIGVGHLGVQGFWAKLGVRYSDIPRSGSSGMLATLYHTVRETARDYAFELRIPVPIKVTTVAPTGSIAKLPGVTEGIHPIYSRYFERRIRFSLRDPDQANTVLEAMELGFKTEIDSYDQSGQTAIVVYPTEDALLAQVRELGWHDPESLVQSADEIHPDDMLAVQEHYQSWWADNAVSYTVNIIKDSITPAGLSEILARRLPRLKGTTIMVDESRPQAPYTRITREQYEAATAKTVEDSTDIDCASGACPIK